MKMRFLAHVEPRLFGKWGDPEKSLADVLQRALWIPGARSDLQTSDISVLIGNPSRATISLSEPVRDIETVKDILNEALLVCFDSKIVSDWDIEVEILYQ